MAQPQAGLKLLRVALIQGSKITEDRTLKRRGPVSVGQNATNTIVVPVSNLPPSFTLFEAVNDQYSLVFTTAMEGKISVNGQEITLQDAIAKGVAKQRRDAYVIPLTDASKGRVALGEVSLLFQFVAPPPEPPKVALPTEVRGGILKQIDQFFFMILAASLVVHFSGATFIACQPVVEERELTLDELPDRFVKAMMPVEIKPPPPVEVADNGQKDEPKEDKKVEKAAEKPATNAAEKKAQLQAKVARSGLLKVIGSSGAGGAFEDVLGSSSGVGDVASALSGASGVGVATADSLAAGGPKGGTAGSAAGIGDLGTSGGGNVGLGEKKEATVRGGVSMQAPEVDSTDVDREKLAAYVRSRKGAIQQCYEKELKRNPSLKGKVVVRFSITPAGRTSDIDIEENTLGNEAVASCIKTTIRGWVFPFKPPSDVPVAYPFVFAPAS
ncbi:MAG: AgmX/PglI C-terminal domain-containing protein [Archangium sp.]|nr:AgmX/PglI C-terminal domain-containing protein [Archangium sp.]MDP3576058.1 AgmX/PglI C-terminal domain-containing protein [Archangium sp.]